MAIIRLKVIGSAHEAELRAQGWIKKTTIGEPRLSEIVENYRNMGFEVYVVEHPADPSDDHCNTCYSADAEVGKMYGDIYVRRGAGGTGARALEEDLY